MKPMEAGAKRGGYQPSRHDSTAERPALAISKFYTGAGRLFKSSLEKGPRPRRAPHRGRGLPSFAAAAARSLGSRLVAAPLDVAAGEDAGDVVEHVSRRILVIAIAADQPPLDDVDLLLGVLVDDARDQAGQLDRVLLVLE